MKNTTYITIKDVDGVNVTIRANSIERIFDHGKEGKSIEYIARGEYTVIETKENVFEKLERLTDFCNIR
jgi:hypothetical protein